MHLVCKECGNRETIRKRYVIMYFFTAVAMWCLYAFMTDMFKSTMADAFLVVAFIVCIVAVPFGGEMAVWLGRKKGLQQMRKS